ncbi:unnamed protein product [Trichobilharzia regenti]|nr:unnamed protein product [Trichobilharzia regenti]
MSPSCSAGALILEDGTIYNGVLFGAKIPQSGEVVFQTGMVGYIESLTDPSYHTQLLVLTYPSIGTLLGKIVPVSVDPESIDWYNPSKHNLVAEVSRDEIQVFNPVGDIHIAALDCGMKLNQIRCFVKRGAKNHGYAVDTKTISDGWYELFQNKNDHSNEGLAHHIHPWMTVQFHPEHMAGPIDLEFLFDVFVNYVRSPNGETLSDRLTEHMIYVQEPFEKILCGKDNKPRKVLLLGSGGLSIGQAGEFDYSGSQALKALREEGIQTLLVNPNIATVQTTEGMADKQGMHTSDIIDSVITATYDRVRLTFMMKLAAA